MKSYNEKVKSMYRVAAPIYDLMDVIGFPIKKFNPRYGMARQIPNEDISILDVCFGTGNSSIAIAKKNNRNRIVGVDLSEEMLTIAKRKLQKLGLENVTAYCLDATKIELNEQFDVVTTSLSLHEMPDDIMSKVIFEMSRVLKSNGKMYIMDWAKPQNPLASAFFMFFPYLFEPKGFGSFLKLDWNKYLRRFGLNIEKVERYGFTKLIIASKTPVA